MTVSKDRGSDADPQAKIHPPGGHELVVVANRLPVDRRTLPDGTTSWQPSPGGLVAALEPVMQSNAGAWVGWTGSAGDTPEPFDARGIRLIPVPFDDADVEEFYEGMSNGSLWPLYHDVIVRPEFHRRWWEAYVRVNQRFAEMAVQHAAEGALVWVQDYQLQLVPQMLRGQRPDLRIGFFNHIPFPPYEIFAQLPWRRQVLEGLLGADQLGFQRPADANNFLRACRRNGLVTRRGMVRLPGEPRFGSPTQHPPREVRAAAFPISIDARRIEAMAKRDDVQERARQIRRELGDPRVLLLGVDRLDYTKGILHRLKAVEELFGDGELASEDAVLVQVATPSRERVEQYRRMREDVEVTVGRINGDHGRLGRPAVHYLHHSYPREELTALYIAADALLVTALRDGMNLVAKEYVAARHDERGALVLSEFAGAAIELPQAFLVNPHDIDGLKAAILNAVHIPPREAGRRMRAMRRRVFEHDVGRWAATFLHVASHPAGRPAGPALPGDLQPGTAGKASGALSGVPLSELPEPAIPGVTVDPSAPGLADLPVLPDARTSAQDELPDDLAVALEKFAHLQSLLVALDYDGVLAPIVADPQAARMLPSARRHLSALSMLPGVRLALVSGRGLHDLRKVASPPEGVLLVGSHGAEIFDPREGDELQILLDGQTTALLRQVTDALGDIASAYQGTHVELKPAGAVLHTRRATRDNALLASKRALEGPASWPGVHLTRGKEVVELSVVEVNKGTALQRLRAATAAEGVLFAGDDVTDERGFAVLDDGAGDVTVKVGSGPTVARHRLAGPEEVATMLARLAELCQE